MPLFTHTTNPNLHRNIELHTQSPSGQTKCPLKSLSLKLTQRPDPRQTAQGEVCPLSDHSTNVTCNATKPVYASVPAQPLTSRWQEKDGDEWPVESVGCGQPLGTLWSVGGQWAGGDLGLRVMAMLLPLFQRARWFNSWFLLSGSEKNEGTIIELLSI
ncbi:hypothetical protein ACOMHN_030543 [Nucella lapillus]